MAERVAKWPEEYGIDGIDLDLEDGAGDTPKAGPNMIHFVRRLRQLQPKMIIGRILFIFKFRVFNLYIWEKIIIKFRKEVAIYNLDFVDGTIPNSDACYK